MPSNITTENFAPRGTNKTIYFPSTLTFPCVEKMRHATSATAIWGLLIGMTNGVHLHTSFTWHVNGNLLHEAVDYSQIVNPSGYIECLEALPEDTQHTRTHPAVTPGSRAVCSPLVCHCVQWPQRLVLVSLQRDQRDMSFIAAGTLFSTPWKQLLF